MNSYYMTVIEEYENGKEVPGMIERNGLFKSYLEASEYLVDEGFDIYVEKCGLTDEYELYFEIPSYMGSEWYIAYIEKWNVR